MSLTLLVESICILTGWLVFIGGTECITFLKTEMN